MSTATNTSAVQEQLDACRVTDTDITTMNVKSAPDVPENSDPQDNKHIFDKLPEFIAKQYNSFLDGFEKMVDRLITNYAMEVGAGNMNKIVYDTDDDGTVNSADNGIFVYTHSATGLAGRGNNGRFKATVAGTFEKINVNGISHTVKCGTANSIEFTTDVWYSFVLDGDTINFNQGGAAAGLNLKIVGGTTEYTGENGIALLWDGNPTDLGSIDLGGTLLYRVSETVPLEEKLMAGGFVVVNDAQVQLFDQESVTTIKDENGNLLIAIVCDGLVFIVYNPCEIEGIVMDTPGVYMMNADGVYATYFYLQGDIREGTIWVKTDMDIGWWAVSPTEPAQRKDGSALQAGDVWIETGDTADIVLDAGGDNLINLPIEKIYLYSGSEWVLNEAQIYIDGDWEKTENRTYLFKANTVTGWGTEWVVKNDSTAAGELTNIAYGADGCICSESQTSNMYGQAFCQDAIDVTNLTAVEITFAQVPTLDAEKENRKFKFGLSSKASESVAYDNFWQVYHETDTSTAGRYTLDVSALTGQLYIAVRVQYGKGAFAISAVSTI